MNSASSSTKNKQTNPKDPISDKVRENFMEAMKNSNSNNSSIDNFKKRVNKIYGNNSKPNSKTSTNSTVSGVSSTQKNNNPQQQLMQQKINNLEQQVEEFKTKLEEANNLYLKAVADLQNTQKQNEIDLSSAKKTVKKNIAKTLSVFVNTFNLAFSYQPKTEDVSVQKFIKTLQDSFDKSVKELEFHNIKFLIPVQDDVFDPNFMEILNPDSIQDKDNVKVKQVVSVAVKVDDQLIQPASVMV